MGKNELHEEITDNEKTTNVIEKEEKDTKKGIKKIITNATFWTLAKYVFSLIIIVLPYFLIGSKKYVVSGIIELLIVAFITDIFVERFKWVKIVNSILMLLINGQYLVLYFGGTYLTFQMLESTASIKDLEGKAFIYAVGVLITLFFSFIPVKKLPDIKIQSYNLAIIALVMELVFVMVNGELYSALYAVKRIYDQYQEQKNFASMIDDAEYKCGEFYKQNVSNCIRKPDTLVEKPNVIIIFTEGLSSNVVEDERGIMPNLAGYMGSSLTFDNYYNHTFATYRGIIGQYYSGYQLNDSDNNTLVSLHGILGKQGYKSSFICTEPNNVQFVKYLESFEFDDLVLGEGEFTGQADSMSDKEAYDLLFSTAEKMGNDKNPFILGIYTFGTHATFDSPDYTFGDGSNRVLNRFYNADYWFGEFMDKFNNSPLADNTIIVFTTDHCTFNEADYINAFPDYPRPYQDVDEIPLMIYYKGIQQRVIDVQGRNSLDMAPTILDYLDVSDVNYFLGDSLFNTKQNSNNYDTVFYDPSYLVSTDNGVLVDLEGNQREIVIKGMQEYFVAKKQIPKVK